jgi:hypothetical protein
MGTRHLTHRRTVIRASRPVHPVACVSQSGREPLTQRASRLVRLGLAVIGAVALLTGAIPGIVPRASAATPASAYIGFDVSWPNCGRSLPTKTVLAVVGVTGGKPYTKNPCFRAQYAEARRHGVVRFYMNLNKPRGEITMRGPAGHCNRHNWSCRGYNYGWHAASAAWRYAASQIGTAPLRTRWWLDVETSNTWSSNTRINARVIAGALAFLRSRGHADRVGVYSTNYQWRRIAGSYRPGVAVWYATVAKTAARASVYCHPRYGFTGGPVRMVQYSPVHIDRDYLCH